MRTWCVNERGLHQPALSFSVSTGPCSPVRSPRFERGIEVPKTSALPLGQDRKLCAVPAVPPVGFEPTVPALRGQCLNRLAMMASSWVPDHDYPSGREGLRTAEPAKHGPCDMGIPHEPSGPDRSRDRRFLDGCARLVRRGLSFLLVLSFLLATFVKSQRWTSAYLSGTRLPVSTIAAKTSRVSFRGNPTAGHQGFEPRIRGPEPRALPLGQCPRSSKRLKTRWYGHRIRWNSAAPWNRTRYACFFRAALYQ